MNNFQDKANFIWQVADDILRGTFKQHEYGDVILPFVVLRRLDCVLEEHKDAVIATNNKFKDILPDPAQVLLHATNGLNFYNTSYYDLRRLAQDAGNVELNFNNYINGFSANVREMIENFQIDKIAARLVKNDLMFMLVAKFTEIDLHPDVVANHEMGYIFEELLRRFSEMSNETAGEHYTPREVIRLMVNLLFAEHQAELQSKGIIRTVFDPACGTGGMLIIAKEHIQQKINPDVEIVMYGQELNEQTYAIAKSDVLIMGEEADNIRPGTSFSEDKFKGNKFNYMLSNPPFGVSWKKEQEFIKDEANDPYGRFHAGLPRVSDGALLFLQHMISKMEPRGSRIAIIFNGSPLFTGDAGSGESNIRKWLIENDWLEAIIALPTELFYNTGIATYIWIVSNHKPERRIGKVQLINAVGYYNKMRKSLGNKRNYVSDVQIREITGIYSRFEEGENCKIFDNDYFGYTKITVERPLMERGEIACDKILRGKPKPDTSLRDYEKVPLNDDVDEYFDREVKPHVADAWMDRSKDKIGYEINFTKYFYEYKPLRALEEIKADILALECETDGLLKEIMGDARK
jgi:type I restriction enzyme M protein